MQDSSCQNLLGEDCYKALEKTLISSIHFSPYFIKNERDFNIRMLATLTHGGFYVMSKKISTQIAHFNAELRDEMNVARSQWAKEMAQFSTATALQLYNLPPEESVPMRRQPVGSDLM